MRAQPMNPLPAVLAVFLALVAAPAPAASGWGAAELRQYLAVANAYRPTAVALEERKLALSDGSKYTLEERTTRGKALREEGSQKLDALLQKAGLSRAVYELLHEAPPYEFGGFPNVGGVLGNKDGKDRAEGVAYLVDAGPVVLLVMALELGYDFEYHFAPLTLGLRGVSVAAASPPKRKGR
jgi:hypothetical protein